MCITTEWLKFLDIRNYLTPGFDYATYLKAYKCTVLKGYFPYEWMDNLEKLKQTCLPSHQEFYSTLKGTNITEEEICLLPTHLERRRHDHYEGLPYLV